MFSNYDLGVVIPVRLGSSRVSRKALLEVGPEKISLLAWKIRQLKKIMRRENIYVSTESIELKEIALAEGVKIHEREHYLADGHKASFSEVIEGVVKDIPHEHIAWVTCVVPLMSPAEYLQGFEEYYCHVIPNNSEHDSLVSVNLIKEYLWNDDGPINYSATKHHTVSQDLPNIYQVTNGLYMAPKKLILENKYLLGPKPFKSCVSKIAGIDIDEYEDYEVARSLVDLYNSKTDSSIEARHVFLDFDGVIVDSVMEAYAVAMISTNRCNSIAQIDVNTDHYQRFCKQRCHIGPAWNYFYLMRCLDEGSDVDFHKIVPNEPGTEAKLFQRQFFATRDRLRETQWQEWLNLSRLYPGAERFIELLNDNRNISILTTKDKGAVNALLKQFGLVANVTIYDAKSCEKFGCKSLLIDDFMRKSALNRAMFIDDSYSHLAKCSWVGNLDLVQAKWGYVESSVSKDNKDEVLSSIREFLK